MVCRLSNLIITKKKRKKVHSSSVRTEDYWQNYKWQQQQQTTPKQKRLAKYQRQTSVPSISKRRSRWRKKIYKELRSIACAFHEIRAKRLSYHLYKFNVFLLFFFFSVLFDCCRAIRKGCLPLKLITPTK